MSQPKALEKWWLWWNRREKLREAMREHERVIVVPRHSEHLIIEFEEPDIVPDSALVVYPRSDWVNFGILQSRPHSLWVRLNGSTLETRPRYVPTQGFDTFAFPAGLEPNRRPEEFENAYAGEIAVAAERLYTLRDNWVKAPIAGGGEPRARRDLYNEGPPWLQRAHDELDDAVVRAYAWVGSKGTHDELSDAQIITKLYDLNRLRSKPSDAA